MLEFLSIPHVELLGIIGCIGVASVAAWSSAAVNMRLRMIERDIDDLYDEVRTVREDQAYRANVGQPIIPVVPAQTYTNPSQRPTRQAGRVPGMARPTQPAMLTPLAQQYAPMQVSSMASDEGRLLSQRPDVALLAEQLSRQSVEQMDEVLTPALDLGASVSTLGAGRQESRLLRWMNGVTGQFSTVRQ